MSPHARGLHPEPDRVVHVHGIIPARAGFTQPHTGHRPGHGDHPRSRGVYPPRRPLRRSPPGSSPLARGLPSETENDNVAERIIPARAGFTATGAGIPLGLADHPRSRGVYTAAASSATSPSGSSPLARGLHTERRAYDLRPGIIPARAGFTPSSAGSSSPRTDHPRSRGIYLGLLEAGVEELGSSPLARGLLTKEEEQLWDAGIIPARAGFTAPPPPGSGGSRDHPRSRGVYPSVVYSRPARDGSSPLARGLPSNNGQALS